MNKEEALKILGFSESDNPSKRKVQVKYEELIKEQGLKLCTDENQDEEGTVNNECRERLKQIFAAYLYLTSRHSKMTSEEHKRLGYEINRKDLDEINSADDLQSSLRSAILNKDVEYLKELFSKFKSSKDGQFGDYINKPYVRTRSVLALAVYLQNIEIVELFLKNGADPNKNLDGYLRDNEIKKLLVEYGRVDKSSIFNQLACAVLTSYVAFVIYSSRDASFLRYAGVAAFALVAVFLVTNAIHDVFYAQTKWPSPDFDEVNAEQVINNVGLNAEDNSQKIGNALA